MSNSEGPSSGRNLGTVVTYALYGVCAALIVAELVIDREAEFSVEGWFGFYAVFGFAAYCAIVNAAKVLRRIVRRPEQYYVPDDDLEEPSSSAGRLGGPSGAGRRGELDAQ